MTPIHQTSDLHGFFMPIKDIATNPYRPSSSPPQGRVRPPTRFLAGSAVAAGVLGAISWAMMFYGLRDVEIRQEPGYQIVLHPTELTASFGLGYASLVVGLLGFIRAFISGKNCRVWMICIAALTLISCLPALTIGQQYLLVMSSE